MEVAGASRAMRTGRTVTRLPSLSSTDRRVIEGATPGAAGFVELVVVRGWAVEVGDCTVVLDDVVEAGGVVVGDGVVLVAVGVVVDGVELVAVGEGLPGPPAPNSASSAARFWG